MTQSEKTHLEERIVDVLKTVYDPEIPVNIYDLGMIYKIDGYDIHGAELSGSRLYIGRCAHEGRECRGHYLGDRQPRVRTSVGPEHDERRSPRRTWI